MTLSIDWTTQVITVPQADLTLVSGTLYELDTDAFRLALKAIEASEEGIVFPDTHRHNTQATVAGTTFARLIEIINGYSVEFEDDAYSVRLAESNNNIFDVESGILVQNGVQVISQNAAGLIVTVSGSGVTEQDKTDIANAVWATVIEGSLTAAQAERIKLAALAGKVSGAAGSTITFRDTEDTTDRIVATVDGDGNRTGVTLDPD